MTNRQALVFGGFVLVALVWAGAVVTGVPMLYAVAGYTTANFVRSVLNEVKE